MYSHNKNGIPKKEKPQIDYENLIEIVNELQNKLAASGNTLNISLPQIVVVGCQSAGKSSVLENIVGREFLPRGTGVVTRRPTVVQLLPSDDEYAVFLHKQETIFKDFCKVKEEIENETFRDPGPDGFCSTPICLKIYSPKVLKLTLVDLPGLIKVAVGNQSEDTIHEVYNMVLQYIKQPNSLILAVSPANQDIANSDALEIAKTVDPERIRTIGVLTKLDIMDDGTDARDILENKKISLKRGFVGVVNRSQKDIGDGKDIDYCLDKEKNFFASMNCYRHMADRMGIPYLRRTLNQQLYEHIKESLPMVRQELSQKLEGFRKQQRDFNNQYGRSSNKPFGVQFHMIKLVENFIEKFCAEIFGYSEKVNMNKLSAGAMINYKLYRDIQNDLVLPEVPDKRKLLIIITSLHGVRNTLSMPSLALEAVMNDLLTQYIAPLNNLVDKVADILQLSVEELTSAIKSYPNLRRELLYLIRKSIYESAFNTKESLEKHMRAEMYFVNTYHKDFAFPDDMKKEAFFPMKLWENGFIDPPFIDSVDSTTDDYICDEKEAVETLASNEFAKESVNVLANIIENYLNIQQKHIADTAVKYIMYFLVKNVMDFVKLELLATILECANSDSILEECEKDFNKIMEIESTCKCLEDALVAIQTF